MKAKIITLAGNKVSETAAAKCIQSSKKVGNDFDIEVFDAINGDEVPKIMNQNMLQWTYPLEGGRYDFATGLKLTAYPTADPNKRIACFLSHWMLWQEVIRTNEPMLILEHDAIFTYKLDPKYILESSYECVGINDPRGATRRSQAYHDIIQGSHNVFKDIINIPKIDEYDVPQGLAGNSAYIIKPGIAAEACELIKKIGIWPNDALLCYQNFKNLGVTTKYHTAVQRTPSTTTL